MTVEQAFQTLGIPIDSDESAISKAYHDLSQLHHPDKPSGDGERQAEINQAHEILMAVAGENRALVLIRNTQALHEVKALMLSEQAARKATEEVATAKRRGVGPLHRMKTIVAGRRGCGHRGVHTGQAPSPDAQGAGGPVETHARHDHRHLRRDRRILSIPRLQVVKPD
jgi:hypothetical protein